MQRYTLKKKNIIIYLLLLSVAIGLMLYLRMCTAKEDLYGSHRQGNSEGDTIDIALLYAPMSYYMYDDTLGGYCYDALRCAAKISNTAIRLWPVINVDDAIGKLDKGDFDIVAPISVDNALRAKYDFTEPIYLDRQVLIQRKGSDGRLAVTSSLDLALDTLHLAQGSPVVFRLHNLMKEIGDTIHIVSHEDLSDEYLVMKVAAGEIQYAVVADRVAKKMHENYPEIDYSTPISFTQFQGGVIRSKDADTKQKFDAMMKLYEKSDAAGKLKQRYGLAIE